MNSDIYNKILSNGLQMSSPSIDVGNSALVAVNHADSVLAPLENLGVIDNDILQSTRSSLSKANSGVTSTVSHIALTANDSLRLSSMTNQVNNLDALVYGVPSTCFNSEALFSSVNGVCDEALNTISDTAEQISEKVADYTNDLISASELEAFLSSMAVFFQSDVDSLALQLIAENALLTELKNKIQASSTAQSIEALWKNPCTQSVLDTTLPSDIKALL